MHLEAENSRYVPSLGSKDFQVEGTPVKVSWARFNPNGKESADSNKAGIFLPGWPLLADSPATWELPRQLSNHFGLPFYNIDAVASTTSVRASHLEARAIHDFLVGLPEVNEMVMVAHSEANLRVGKVAVMLEQEDPQIKVKGVVSISPMGLYGQNFLELFYNFAIREPIIEFGNKNPREHHMPLPEFIGEMADGILQDIRATKIRYPAMLVAQMRAMMSVDPALSQLRAPLVVIATGKDYVSDYRRYLPAAEIEKRTAGPISDAQLTDLITRSEKWDHLCDSEYLSDSKRERFKTMEEFIKHYATRYRVGELMTNTALARSRYLAEQLAPKSKRVLFLLAKRFGSHIGIPTERPEQAAHFISEIFDRFDRMERPAV